MFGERILLRNVGFRQRSTGTLKSKSVKNHFVPLEVQMIKVSGNSVYNKTLEYKIFIEI